MCVTGRGRGSSHGGACRDGRGLGGYPVPVPSVRKSGIPERGFRTRDKPVNASASRPRRSVLHPRLRSPLLKLAAAAADSDRDSRLGTDGNQIRLRSTRKGRRTTPPFLTRLAGRCAVDRWALYFDTSVPDTGLALESPPRPRLSIKAGRLVPHRRHGGEYGTALGHSGQPRPRKTRASGRRIADLQRGETAARTRGDGKSSSTVGSGMPAARTPRTRRARRFSTPTRTAGFAHGTSWRSLRELPRAPRSRSAPPARRRHERDRPLDPDRGRRAAPGP